MLHQVAHVFFSIGIKVYWHTERFLVTLQLHPVATSYVRFSGEGSVMVEMCRGVRKGCDWGCQNTTTAAINTHHPLSRGLICENIHFKILKTIATSGFLTALVCTKFVFGQGSAPDPAGGAYSAP